jgi:hypothetical protein
LTPRKAPETLRSHTLQVGKQLGAAAAEKPPAATAITITLDSTFIRSREESERHLEVRVGNVETSRGGRQVFGAVTRADTEITAPLRRTIETVGRDDDPGGVTAKATIVAEVERLHWHIWNGKAKNARRSINRIRKVMHVHMRWSRHGADLLLQVRCAVYNGTLGPGFRHRFDRVASGDPALAKAA